MTAPTMEFASELAEDFTRRLIQSGYRQDSVEKAVAKVYRLLSHSVIYDDITRSGPCRNCEATPGCNRCSIYLEGASKKVPGHGNPSSPIMFVGEGPGEHEDMFGIPFIGIAGTALTLWLEKMPLKREQVYITNVLKCRPENNRTPAQGESDICIEEHLKREIEIIKPRAMVAIGAVALKALVPGAPGITSARGDWFDYNGIPLTAVFHPAYVLRKRNREFAEVNQLVYKDLVEAFRKLNK